ncbi:hypothetical protein HU200_030738 [Digitaria exilis]|uniref:Uncharacterized protein n=1 Tax=Digitaria exilis TaxID=1010633 RepID=A0A835ETS9_9POAL|nr:hypothetical protein HU200_030738 [Digitaria exilis]
MDNSSVLVSMDYMEVPKGNVLPRWTKQPSLALNTCTVQAASEDEADKLMKKALLLKTLEIVNGKRKLDEAGFKQAMTALEQEETAKQCDPVGSFCMQTFSSPTKCDVPLSCPKSSYTGGRPPNTGMKSWLAKTNKKVNKTSSDSESMPIDWPEEEAPKNKKTKRLKEI